MVLASGTRALMRDGASIPLIGFGTYLLSPEQAKAAVLEALRVGYRHIDTAEGYKTESHVGEALRESGVPREEVFITSKVFPGNPVWHQAPKTFDGCIAACEGSLARLGTSYLDLYLIHAPFCQAERLEQWRALLELQRLGSVRSVGVSNYAVAHLEEIRAAGLTMPAVNQVEMHPFCSQAKLCEYMAAHKVLPVAYSSLAPLSSWREGQPSGKQSRGANMIGGQPPFPDLASRHGASEAQILLRWAVQKGFPVLPKSASPERIRQNFELFHFELSDEDMAALDALDQGLAVAWAPLDPTSVL
mmetsp:Transcript_25021/g.83527  ORF Transcript_25021/g.83527 Transcript_25021/m.83527 type:complete len:303 (-) Transcript_25021:62-970(-)